VPVLGSAIYVVGDQGRVLDVFNREGGTLQFLELDFFSIDGIASGDVTGDGIAELLVADDGTFGSLTAVGVGDVHIYSAAGRKIRTLPKAKVDFTEGDGFAVGDVTGDGVADLVIAGDGGHLVEIFDQDGDRIRPSFVSVFTTGDDLAVGDVLPGNGGRAEIVVFQHNVVSLGHETPNSGQVVIYADPGFGFFIPLRAFTVHWPVQSFRKSSALGDLNGDGVAEIILANVITGFIDVFTADGHRPIPAFDGDFQPGNALAAGDVFNTGNDVIVVAGDNSGRICIFGAAGTVEFASGFNDGDFLAIERSARDSDGDGLLDRWEIDGLRQPRLGTNGKPILGPDGKAELEFVLDRNFNPVLPPGRRDAAGVLRLDSAGHPVAGADWQHKDLFLELDWMNGGQPSAAAIALLKAAFAVAPADAGGIRNPDGLPGITLWVDTGNLSDPNTIPALGFVGDEIFTETNSSGRPTGGGNRLPTSNVSGLTLQFYRGIKNGGIDLPPNFDGGRGRVFRYGVCATHPGNNAGTSTSGNTATTLNDTNQFWIVNEWNGRTVTATTPSGVTKTGTISSNTINQLTLTAPWSPAAGPNPGTGATYRISTIGGQAEIGGNDLLLFLQNFTFPGDAGTIMHEFGHNLGLLHGGAVGGNCKPNYVSVMNYDHQTGICRVNVAPVARIIDFSPPRLLATPPLGIEAARGTAPLPSLVELVLFEFVRLDPTDNQNQFQFVNALGNKLQWPLDQPVDYDANGTIQQVGPVFPPVNIDTVGLSGRPTACANKVFSILDGSDDWHQIALSFRYAGDSADGALNPVEEPEPPVEDFIAMEEELGPATVTGGIQITRSGFVRNRRTGRYVQELKLKNVSGSVIGGPMTVVLDRLSANAALFDRDGVTARLAPLGSPFQTFETGAGRVLYPTASVSLVLEFTNPTNAGITYDTRVLVGRGNP
jgi:hypothetical protein